MTPFHHSLSSIKKFGGHWMDYMPIHEWFDKSKAAFGDFRHRALRHHSEGIFEMEQHFGVTLTNRDNKEIPTRLIGEQHVIEDCGFIPSVKDWLSHIQPQDWMRKVGKGKSYAIQLELEQKEP